MFRYIQKIKKDFIGTCAANSVFHLLTPSLITCNLSLITCEKKMDFSPINFGIDTALY